MSMEFLIALLAMGVTGITSVTAIILALLKITHPMKRQIAQVNDSVNHRHEKRGDDAPKLYDLIWETHEKSDKLLEWRNGYKGGPLDSGPKVIEFVQSVKNLKVVVDDLNDKVCNICKAE